MKRMLLVGIAVAVIACGSTRPVDAPTTTSATVLGSSQMPFDLPNTLLRERTDAEISRKLLDRLLSDARLSPRAREVSITTRDHEVTLSGTVTTPEERRTIELVARQIAGVTRVHNRIDVAVP